MKDFDVYITRDTSDYGVAFIWEDVEVGITKWHGCIQFGSGSNTTNCTTIEGEKEIDIVECRKRYGFTPRLGTAYNVYTKNGKIVRKRVDTEIEFCDYPSPKNGKNYTKGEVKEGCIEEINSKDLPEEIKEKAVKYIKEMTKKELSPIFRPTIMGTFAWSDHKAGHYFWMKIDRAEYSKR